MIYKEKCRFYKKEIEFELYGNCTVYCPFCLKLHNSECEYGFGPVVPFYYSIGKLVIAKLDCDSLHQYFLKSDWFETKLVKGQYLDAIPEADEIINKSSEVYN